MGVGDYNIVYKTRFDCTSDPKTITLEAPIGFRTSHCDNGDFENGNFENWEGGLTINNDGYPVFDNTDLDIQSQYPRHSIINTSDFEDPWVPEINNSLFELGRYIAKLGNALTGSESERLIYHFTVDDINKNFYFNYALVQQDPNDNNPLVTDKHDDIDRPFFSWKIYKENNPDEILFQQRTISNDPFLVESPKQFDKYWDLHYKGWTCQNYDLSDFIGEELVIEFINADCTLKGHWGYTYLDGICGKGFTPNPIITTKNVICKNQYNENFEVKVEGAGFNRFYWDCTIINSSGEISHQFTTPEEIGYSDIIPSLIDFIYEYSNNSTPLECDSKIILGFNGLSDCFDQRVETEIIYSCVSHTVDYCDPLLYCGGEQVKQVQIIGDIDCVNCTYTWESNSPYGGLNHYDIPFPIVDREHQYNAFNNTYSVNVISPEGCEYNDEVTLKPGPDVSITRQIFLQEACSGDPDYAIVYVSIYNCGWIYGHNHLSFVDDVTGERYFLTKDYENSSENVNKWFGSFDLDQEYNLELDLSEYHEFDDYPFCFNQEYTECEFETFIHLDAVPINHLGDPWVVYIPNIFDPYPDGVYDYFFISNYTMDENDLCNNFLWNNELSSISYYKMQIFDRWGELLFEGELTYDPSTGNGVNTMDIKWDGTYLDELCNSGVYTWLIEIHSCYTGNLCPSLPSAFRTNNELITIWTGDVEIP